MRFLSCLVCVFAISSPLCLAQTSYAMPGNYTEGGSTFTGYYFVPPSSVSTDNKGDGTDHFLATFLPSVVSFGPYCAAAAGNIWIPYEFNLPFHPDPQHTYTYNFTLTSDGKYTATDSWQVLYDFGTHQWTDTLQADFNAHTFKYNYNFTAVLNNGQIFKFTQDTSGSVIVPLQDPSASPCKLGGANTATMTLESLEVTQGIQNPANYVPLIAGKPAYARAYVTVDQANQTSTPYLTAIRTSSPGAVGVLSPAHLVPENPGLVVPQTLDRSKLFQSYLFTLPPDWLTGTVELTFNESGLPLDCENAISHTIDLASKLPEPTNSKGHDCTTIATFNNVPPIKLKVYKLVPIGSGLSDGEVASALADIKQVLPMSSMRIQDKGTIYLPAAPSTALGFIAVNLNLALVRYLDCYADCNWIYLGILPKASASPGVRGLGNFPTMIASGYSDQLTLAHELGHVAGLKHVYYTGNEQGVNVAYPYKDSTGRGVIGGNLSVSPPDDLLYYGFDPRILALSTALKPPTAPDLMSYGAGRWPSDYTYDYVRAYLTSQFPQPPSSAPGGPQAAFAASGPDVALVSGIVNINGSTVTGSIGMVQRVTNDPSAAFGGTGTWTLREEDSSANVLGVVNFEPIPTSDDPTVAGFAFTLPLAANATKFTLLHSGTVIASRAASAHAPVVAITYPDGGENLTGTTATFTWTASDADNDPLTYTVQFSPDGGTNWNTLAVGLTSPSFAADLTALAGTTNGLIRVYANDGFNTTNAQSAHVFTVPNHPPAVHILAPVANLSLTPGQTLLMSGYASDPLDGPLPGTSLTWNLDSATTVGTGADLTYNTAALKPGIHTLTVTATDSKSLTAQASVNIVVAGPIMSIAKSHSGNFAKGQQNAGFSVTVSNAANAPPTSGTITVTENVPAGMTLVSMSGSGWTCSSNTCTRGDVLSAGTSFPAIAVTVNIASNAAALLGNRVSVTGGGSAAATATDVVTITGVLTNPPFGSFDTPVNNTSGVVGGVGVTGWALANSGISKVDIYRDPVGAEPGGQFGLVFIGTATFVAGARPDVQAQYPTLPNANKAGWGYMLLTNFLPDTGAGPGNGTYRLHAIAYDAQGNFAELSAPGKTIVCDNAHAAKPFGTIDTPDQGATVSGKQYVNFGWTLTPGAGFAVPTDGSTITVSVDGVTLGHPTYNQYRSDIATTFPGYTNSNGAVGYYFVDTTKLTAGVHTIGWVVYDDHGRGEGIGSRFFTVANGPANAPDEVPVEAAEGVRIRRGFARDAQLENLKRNAAGEYEVSIEEMDRLEIHGAILSGYQIANGERSELPAGSTVKGGVFYWQLGPAFLGRFELVFLRSDGTSFPVHVMVLPKSYRRSEGGAESAVAAR